MFLRVRKRNTNGKLYRYRGLVENRRVCCGRAVQRHAEPEPEVQLLLERLNLRLTSQPPPRIYDKGVLEM